MAEPFEVAAGLVESLEGDAPLSARLDAMSVKAAELLGAEALLVEAPLGDARVRLGGLGASSGEDAVVVAGGGVTVRLRPASLLERRRAEVAFVARVTRAAVERAREASRALRAEEAISAVTHDVNNALTPLLCSPVDAVAAAALRLRSHIELLRQLRGRSRPRELLRVPAWLERLRKLLAVTGGGSFPVEVQVDEGAQRRAIGPEQGALLPLAVSAGLALRVAVRPGTPVRLAGGIDRDGRVEVVLSGEVEAPGGLATLVDLSERPGLRPRVRLDGGRVEVRVALEQRPRVLLLAGPAGKVPVPAEAVVRAFRAVGVEAELHGQAEEALRRCLEPPEPAWVLGLPGAEATLKALRSGLQRALPAVAGRCLPLDDRLGVPGHRPSAEEVDVAAVFASCAGVA